MDTEKITINLGAIDLGQIDLLLEHGYYSNRTDFIRTAIRMQLEKHSNDVKDLLKNPYPQILESEYSETSINVTTGIVKLRRKELEHFKKKNLKVNIKMVGMLIIDNDVTPELAGKTINSVKVYGIIRASDEVKKVISSN